MSGWLRTRVVVDRFVAAVLLALTSPLIALLAALVRRHDGGRAFVAVPRVGRGGTDFAMWKLRSMRIDGPDGRASGVSLTAGSDPRITPVGAKLRA